jgi:hypothetical protein
MLLFDFWTRRESSTWVLSASLSVVDMFVLMAKTLANGYPVIKHCYRISHTDGGRIYSIKTMPVQGLH